MSIARSRMPRIPCEDGRRPAAGRGRRRGRVSTVRLVGALEPQLDRGRVGVAGDVRQRLLRDAVDDELLLLGEWQRALAGAGRRGRCACSPNAVASADSALCSPRSSSASGRSRRAIRRTSSVPCAGGLAQLVELVAQLLGDRRREALDLQHHAGERLADLVVQLARDPPALVLLDEQRLTRALAPLGLEPVEHVVERHARARRRPGRPSTCTRAPGDSGSCRRMVSARSIERPERRSQEHQIEGQQSEQAGDEHDQLDRRRRHRHRHRREDQPEEREHQHRCVRAETRQNSGTDGSIMLRLRRRGRARVADGRCRT